MVVGHAQGPLHQQASLVIGVAFIRLGVLETRTICLFYCLLAFSHAIASVCRGAGKAFVPMTIMLGVWCVFRILYITAIMHWRHEIVYVYGIRCAELEALPRDGRLPVRDADTTVGWYRIDTLAMPLHPDVARWIG